MYEGRGRGLLAPTPLSGTSNDRSPGQQMPPKLTPGGREAGNPPEVTCAVARINLEKYRLKIGLLNPPRWVIRDLIAMVCGLTTTGMKLRHASARPLCYVIRPDGLLFLSVCVTGGRMP